MIYKLSFEQQNQLLNLPETGMGYQLIKARYSGEYRAKEFIALNAELVVEQDNNAQTYLGRIASMSFKRVLNEVQPKMLNDIELLPKAYFFNTLKEPDQSKSKGAKDGPLLQPSGSDSFVRLSAYQDDKRIDKVNKCLLPGSYTTTLKDYVRCVYESDNPVERYALPNDEPIQWAFFILPKTTDAYRFGIVQPDYGKRGGGEECLFEKGTSFNTFKLETKYGSLP